MTLAGTIASTLETNWDLTGDLAKAKIKFNAGWFDNTTPSVPQVTVSFYTEPVGHHFGTLMHTYPHFLVNVWKQIPSGAKGTLETQQIEDMRYEVLRIIGSLRTSILGADTMLVPEDVGIPRHELDHIPKRLRYEITLIGAHTKP